jgi:hypothetical protein
MARFLVEATGFGTLNREQTPGNLAPGGVRHLGGLSSSRFDPTLGALWVVSLGAIRERATPVALRRVRIPSEVDWTLLAHEGRHGHGKVCLGAGPALPPLGSEIVAKLADTHPRLVNGPRGDASPPNFPGPYRRMACRLGRKTRSSRWTAWSC